MEDLSRRWPTDSTKRGSQGLTEAKEDMWSASRFLRLCYDCQHDVVVVILIVGAGISLTLFPAHKIIFLLLGCLAQHQY